jgi:hypothetical protein
LSSAAPSQIPRISLIQFEKKNPPNSSGYFPEIATLFSGSNSTSETSDGTGKCSELDSRSQLPATGFGLQTAPRPHFLGKMHRMMGQNCSPNGADFAKNAFKLSLLTTLGLKNAKFIRINGLPENANFLRGD